MKPSLAELILMQGMLEPYGSNPPAGTGTRIMHNGFRGHEYAKLKARKKVAKESKRRNRR